MAATSDRKTARLKRKKRIRKKMSGTSERPRLNVFRSLKHIYAQVIDDTQGVTLVAASSLETDIKDNSGKNDKKVVATKVGKLIAERAVDKGIKKVVFDRNGFLYHGRVKAVSEGARKGGLEF